MKKYRDLIFWFVITVAIFANAFYQIHLAHKLARKTQALEDSLVVEPQNPIKLIPYEEDESKSMGERSLEIFAFIKKIEESESIQVIRFVRRYERGSDGNTIVTGIIIEYRYVIRC
ncbi:hypothetical protein IT397_02265 [Candidatus Nomurabacteria bacterium]|nr:hypothetical protein [Candidatus Nomurabacteria bacterium]